MCLVGAASADAGWARSGQPKPSKFSKETCKCLLDFLNLTLLFLDGLGWFGAMRGTCSHGSRSRGMEGGGL